MKNENGVFPVPEVISDTRRLTEIRFDCLVTMHDSGTRVINGGFLSENKALPPQWFRAQTQLTLETVQYLDEYTIGAIVKKLFYDLQENINKYENN